MELYFRFIPLDNSLPWVLNSPYGASTFYGQPLTLNGFGFAAKATVKLYWNYHLSSQITLGTIQADSNGTFTITLPTPSSPNLSQVPVAAIDISSKLAALSTFNVQPGIALNPPKGIAGSTLNISGGSFGANAQISISFGSIALPTVTTDTYGTFTISFQVPAGTGNGIVTITINGATSGISLNTGFEYMPLLKITPTEGIPGTTVTLLGQYFGTSGAQISLVDSATGTSFPLGFAYLHGGRHILRSCEYSHEWPRNRRKIKLQEYDQSKVFKGYPNTFGAFNGKYTIPATTAPAALVISANEVFNLSASATFIVIPTITVTPASGTVGTSSITISGAGLTTSMV